jgi:cycloartenol synthase
MNHHCRNCYALQIINPAETFGDIVVDYSDVECTSACITALSAFDRLYPNSS